MQFTAEHLARFLAALAHYLYRSCSGYLARGDKLLNAYVGIAERHHLFDVLAGLADLLCDVISRPAKCCEPLVAVQNPDIEPGFLVAVFANESAPPIGKTAKS
ncbi:MULTISPECIES: hypothetical protein [unclassified Pseudomonas]|nr:MULTISPECIES: hypothetical protein [unclassified Pseudomonas]